MAELASFMSVGAAEEAAAFYGSIFLNPEHTVTMQAPESFVAFVSKAVTTPVGWSTTKAALEIRKLTNLSIVTTLQKFNRHISYPYASPLASTPALSWSWSPG